jgi:bacteriocin-like protein
MEELNEKEMMNVIGGADWIKVDPENFHMEGKPAPTAADLWKDPLSGDYLFML